jgi:hypothetical protein
LSACNGECKGASGISVEHGNPENSLCFQRCRVSYGVSIKPTALIIITENKTVCLRP